MPNNQLHQWYKARGYRHFDSPIGVKPAVALATSPDRVAAHSFLPFIAYKKSVPRYLRRKRLPGQPRLTGTVEYKERAIAYASHADSAIFSFYSHTLENLYETCLHQRGLNECVLAYRKFPDKRCNIDFAHEAYQQINGNTHNLALAFDIEKFFDTLQHSRIKQAWSDVLGKEALPPDHYKVYRAITRYAQVDREALYDTLSIKPGCNYRSQEPLCTPLLFRSVVRGEGLIRNNTSSIGIPQGSPISAVLSNLYMLPFDETVKKFCDANDAVYYRYSDDILIICRQDMEALTETMIDTEIQKLGLTIQPKKTVKVRFSSGATGLKCEPRPLQYLGFIFDGQRILLRSQTLARYHRRSIRTIRHARKAAISAGENGGNRRLYRHWIYRHHSHLNKKQGFAAYVYRAANLTASRAIRRQFKNHWPKLQARIHEADND